MNLRQYCIPIFIASFFLLIPNFGYGQEKISPTLQFQYFKNSDEQRLLKATLTYTLKRKDFPLSGQEITISAGSKKVLLGKIVTDENGIASLILANDYQLPLEKNGTWTLVSEYAGKDSIEATTTEISIKDFHLEMSLGLVDSVKTVLLKAYTVDNGKNIPVSGEAINIYVARTFSLLPVADGTFGEDGTLNLEFPSDIPGDLKGNLTVVAKFDEHPTYGNVEKRCSGDWGVHSKYQEPTTHRALWTKGAPTWMIIALTIMLAGVWGHYMYAVICLIRIKKSSNDDEKLLKV
jgi:hypothetical protein